MVPSQLYCSTLHIKHNVKRDDNPALSFAICNLDISTYFVLVKTYDFAVNVILETGLCVERVLVKKTINCSKLSRQVILFIHIVCFFSFSATIAI